MEKEIIELIKQKNLIKPGETIGVATSGGVDSMSLLHFLNYYKEEFDCSVVAITVDHMIRGEKSLGDSLFVQNWCKENRIYCHKFSVDALKVADEKNIGVEEAAREARYGVFDKLIQENIVDKIALAHHVSDQAETVLLHILRGAGLNGAGGMDAIRDDVFIRPFLNVEKDDIVRYASRNYIEYIEDETNRETKYNRNFLRNVILPELKKRWEGVEQNLVNFAKTCREDNDFILSHVSHGGVIVEKNLVKIPLVYFHYHSSVINRIIFDALKQIDVVKDIERKHIDLIKELSESQNGKKINLPGCLIAQKEYDYITLYKIEKIVVAETYPIKTGKTNFAGLCTIDVKRTKKIQPKEGFFVMDAKKIPDTAVWRTRKNGDVFAKFGSGAKALKNYFIDKKIPNRVRDLIPVLADGKNILCVLGYEISEDVKITEDTTLAYVVCSKSINN
ncbi:MAG: tRNA lysidine(34) synthetase TilS [Clostridia bacterium]|nr:tRNA lysidine(34) synthetase TilS [Clostridia bacterium]